MFLMQARSSVSLEIVTWVTAAPDWTGVDFPGPGVPEHVSATFQPGGGSGGGQSQSTFTLSIGSADLAQGEWFCSANDPDDPTIVTRATIAAARAAGGIIGCVTDAVTHGNAFVGIIAGDVVDATSIGLGPGAAGRIKLGSNAKAARFSTADGAKGKPHGGEIFLGSVDAEGNVFVAPSAALTTSPRHVFNVQAYGAVGDATEALSSGDWVGTDDTAAILACIQAASAAGAVNGRVAEVYFPPGSYRISGLSSDAFPQSHLEVSRYVRLVGDGTGKAKGSARLLLGPGCTIRFATQVCSSDGSDGTGAAINGLNVICIEKGSLSGAGTLSPWAGGAVKSAGNRVMSTRYRKHYYQTIKAGTTTASSAAGDAVALADTNGGTGSGARWRPGNVRSLNDLVLPNVANGFYYKCTTAGTSGGTFIATGGTPPKRSVQADWWKEPTWPTTIGATVTDGTAVWTCQGHDSEPVWENTYIPDTSSPYQANHVYRYGIAVRATNRFDVMFVVVSPSAGPSNTALSGSAEPASFATSIPGDADIVETSGLTWRCLPSGGCDVRADSTVYALKALTRPLYRTDVMFKATAIGSAPHQSSGSEPAGLYTAGVGDTVADGDITWTAIANGASMIKDGGVVWSCRSAGAITLNAGYVDYSKTYVQDSPGAAFIHQGATNATPPINASQCGGRSIKTLGCGAGFTMIGGDANDCRIFDVHMDGYTENFPDHAELGWDDGGFLGSRLTTGSVQNVGGRPYHVYGDGTTGSLSGIYQEGSGYQQSKLKGNAALCHGTALYGQGSWLVPTAAPCLFNDYAVGIHSALAPASGNPTVTSSLQPIAGSGPAVSNSLSSYTLYSPFYGDTGFTNSYAWEVDNATFAAFAIADENQTEGGSSKLTGKGAFTIARGFYIGTGNNRPYFFPNITQFASANIRADRREVGDIVYRADRAAIGDYAFDVVTVANNAHGSATVGVLGVVETTSLAQTPQREVTWNDRAQSQSDPVQTTDNTTTTVTSRTLRDNAMSRVTAEVTAFQTSGTNSPDGATFIVSAAWYRSGGGAPVQVKAPSVVDSSANTNGTAWTAVLDVSGNTVRVRVTGDTGKTIQWTGVLQVTEAHA